MSSSPKIQSISLIPFLRILKDMLFMIPRVNNRILLFTLDDTQTLTQLMFAISFIF